jgi:hypothetical protein
MRGGTRRKGISTSFPTQNKKQTLAFVEARKETLLGPNQIELILSFSFLEQAEFD